MKDSSKHVIVFFIIRKNAFDMLKYAVHKLNRKLAAELVFVAIFQCSCSCIFTIRMFLVHTHTPSSLHLPYSFPCFPPCSLPCSFLTLCFDVMFRPKMFWLEFSLKCNLVRWFLVIVGNILSASHTSIEWSYREIIFMLSVYNFL